MVTFRHLIALILLGSTFVLGASPAFAQIGSRSEAQASDLIEKAEAAMEKGQFDVAVQSFGRALRADDLDEQLVAKTLYQRGVASEKAGQPAQAIADIT